MNDTSERSGVSLMSAAVDHYGSSSISKDKELRRKKRRSPARGCSVRFPDCQEQLVSVVDYVVNREDLTDEDRAALWFCADEYLDLKSDARLESLASERDGLAKTLLEDVHNEKSRAAQEKINRWVVEVGQERRGLERSINKTLADARQNAQFQSIMDVMRAQDEMMMSSLAVDDEELRKVYTQTTRSSRHFARMMAKADALAAGTSPEAVGDAVAMARKNSPRKLKPEKLERSVGRTFSDSHSVISTMSKRKSSKEKKNKRKDKGKDKGEKEHKQKLTLKQKYKDTKAGIIARIPRIA